MRFRLILLLLLTGPLCEAQIPTLTPLAKQEVWLGGTNIMPHWSGGAFLTVSQTGTPPSALTSPDPTVFVAAGEQRLTIPIRIPGAVWTQNRAVARGADGAIAAVGSAKDSSGQTWGYLVFFPPKGVPPLVVHTEPYYATGVTMLPDGTVWTKGTDYRTKPGPDGLYQLNRASANGILRHYSRTGALLESVLPQSDFKPTQVLWGNKIASSANRVGWCQYDGVGGGKPPEGGYYFELPSGGSVSKILLPPFSEGETVDALVITENSYVLLEKSARGSGPHLYALDRAQGIWQPLEFPASGFEGTGYFLLGATGNTLAFWTNGSSGFTAQFAALK